MGIDTARAQEIQKKPNELPDRLSISRSEELLSSGSILGIEKPGANCGSPPSAFNPIELKPFQPRPVVRGPGQLRLHPAMEELGWKGLVDELNGAARLRGQSGPELIFITTSGTILAGFGRWQLALLEQRDQVHCIEYSLDENESLSYILAHHQPSRNWNAFVRIRLALTLTPYFQLKALNNMRIGGKHKGLANLPKADHIDVRQEIARVAGVGSRNVGHVKTILEKAAPRLIEALQNGRLTIHRAVQWCSLSRTQQLEQLTRYNVNRATSKVIRQTIARLNKQNTGLKLVTVLDALQRKETNNPESIVVRTTNLQQTIILVGQDLCVDLPSSTVA